MAKDQHLLIRECCSGNRCSQQHLYNLYAHKMMGVCSWYAKDRQEAEEILQDGFVRVFRYLHKYKGSGSLEGWIRRIMVNAALVRYRKKSFTSRLVSLEKCTYDDADDHNVFDFIEFKELMLLVQELSPVYRLVFNLHVLEGLKHKEIAVILGISEGTSKSNLADARSVLQKKFKALYQLVPYSNELI